MPSPQTPAARNWALRFAPQIGYRSADRPLFRYGAGDIAPARQAAFAADLGFAGVLYPWAAARPAPERAALAEVLQARGMAAGCVVWAPIEMLREPLWGRTDKAARKRLATHMGQAIGAAREIGASTIAVLGAADPDRPIEAERRGMSENLRWAGDLAGSEGLHLGLEPMIALPNMMQRTLADGLEMIQRTAHPQVRLIFDTGHVHAAGDDVLEGLDRALGDICLVQLADQPGRVEPGAGVIDMLGVLRALKRHRYGGLVELEHEWSEPDLDGEVRGLERLYALNDRCLESEA